MLEHDDEHAFTLGELALRKDLSGSRINDPMNETTINALVTLALAVLAPGAVVFVVVCYLQTRKSHPRYDQK